MRMSPAEFDAVSDYDDAYRYELIDGVLVVNPVPSEAEADPNELLGFLLRQYKETHKDGKALDATLPERYVHLPNSRRRADRVIWAGLGRLPRPTRDVPAIVVEFVSAGRRNWRRDYLEKRDEYLAAGVREYWVIDRFARTMTVFRPMTGGQMQETTVAQGKVYTTDILPGFEMPLDELLSAADRWEQGD